jgi:hypothetical protein
MVAGCLCSCVACFAQSNDIILHMQCRDLCAQQQMVWVPDQGIQGGQCTGTCQALHTCMLQLLRRACVKDWRGAWGARVAVVVCRVRLQVLELRLLQVLLLVQVVLLAALRWVLRLLRLLHLLMERGGQRLQPAVCSVLLHRAAGVPESAERSTVCRHSCCIHLY